MSRKIQQEMQQRGAFSEAIRYRARFFALIFSSLSIVLYYPSKAKENSLHARAACSMQLQASETIEYCRRTVWEFVLRLWPSPCYQQIVASVEA